ncbi:MAG: ABC transporter permease subunit [Simkania sp.]|nr:ABC transporter permease subunit [Simkania sp.]
MKPSIHGKLPLVRNVSYLKTNSRLFTFFKQHPHACDCVLILFVTGMIFGFVSYFYRFAEPLQARVDIDLSPLSLPKYTFFSMSRGLVGYILSLIFSLLWGFWAAKDKVAERVLIPVLDILQSIPILGFMPGLILLLVGLFPHNNMGLELAAIIMVFSSQAWNMAFGVYHSIRIIPQDKIDCSAVYRFSNWQRIKWLEIPYTIISLVWNSIMSMAGGWFFLIVNEAFRLGDRDFQLPGLGSYMSVAAANGNIPAMFWAILSMILLIVFLDYFLWKPLVAWSQKFRVEETGSIAYTDSLFFQVITHSFLMNTLRKSVHFLCTLSLKKRSRASKKPLTALIVSRSGLGLLLCVITVILLFLTSMILEIPFDQWLHLGHMTLLTFGRVICCIVIGTFIALPLGLWLGLSKTLSSRLEPVIQVVASFPATLLFPILILLFNYTGISLNIGCIILMLMGTLWYILFNVIAGAKAMPSDLREVSITFRLGTLQKFLRLYLPAVFPYLITGLVAAAGGAWNASIVAEYVSYKDQILTIPGIGSMINLSAQNGNIPLLVASILVMAAVVVILNYQVWLRLFHYSEKRFSLNY